MAKIKLYIVTVNVLLQTVAKSSGCVYAGGGIMMRQVSAKQMSTLQADETSASTVYRTTNTQEPKHKHEEH